VVNQMSHENAKSALVLALPANSEPVNFIMSYL
jgi:hypothetical protein